MISFCEPPTSLVHVFQAVKRVCLQKRIMQRCYWRRLFCSSSSSVGQLDSDGDQHHTIVLPGLSQLHVQTALQHAAQRWQQRTLQRLLSWQFQPCRVVASDPGGFETPALPTAGWGSVTSSVPWPHQSCFFTAKTVLPQTKQLIYSYFGLNWTIFKRLFACF